MTQLRDAETRPAPRALSVTRRELLRTTAVLVAAPPLLAFAGADGGALTGFYAWSSGTAAGVESWVRLQLSAVGRSVDDLKAVKGRRTVGNTLEPYDRARNALAMASNQTQLLGSAGATEEVRDASRRLLDAVGAAAAGLDLDPQVHAALLELSRSAEAAREDEATRRYIEQALTRGRLAGADRDEATRATLRALQSRITVLSARYMINMQGPVGLVRTTVAEMRGLPADFVASHPADANGVVNLTAAQIDVQPVLRFASEPALRRRVHVAYENQGYPANARVLADLVSARAELAQTLGYASYADLTLSDQMVASSTAAETLLRRIDDLSRLTAAREAAAVQAFARSTDPAAVVTSADAAYWSERYRRQTFGIDAQEVRAYLPFARVLPGVMAFAARFFGVAFLPVGSDRAWHPAVRVFDVHDAADGAADRPLGRIYLDAHPRSGKDQTFATAPLVPGLGARQRPQGVILCNLPGGEDGDPGLLGHADVVNLVHEFGHLMHHVLAGQGRWSGQGAFDGEEDFLEAPSQMLEEFARDASFLQSFARHHRTGESMPLALIERLNRSAAFGRAGCLRGQMQRASFALAIHRTAADAAAIEGEHLSTLRRASSFQPVAGTHGYAASPHLIGYGPNYYMYLLDKVIAVDLASRFAASDPTSGARSGEYRRKVLAPGAGRPARAMIQDFLGRDESYDVLSGWMEGGSGRV